MLRQAYIDYLTQQPQRRIDKFLWVSDLGFHPYKAMNRIINRVQEPFPASTISVMEDGNMMEAHSVSIWSKALPATIHTQVPLFDSCWSGYADVILNMGTDRPTIIEHKTAKEAAWKYDKLLGPIKGFHACQLWMYGWLYKNKYGIQPDLILYYRSMGDRWAELSVTTDTEGFVRLDGHLDGNPICLNSTIYPNGAREELERHHADLSLPDAPEGEIWDYAGKLEVRH